VIDPENMNSINGLRLLDAKRTSAHMHGWFVFTVLRAVQAWINGTEPNYGKLVMFYLQDNILLIIEMFPCTQRAGESTLFISLKKN